MMKLFLTVFLLLGLGANDALACRCVNFSPCEFYNRASAIFLGQNITKNETGNLSFRVIEAFKGVQGKTIQVELRGAMCGASAAPNERVLVYAMKGEKGQLVAGNCGFVRDSDRNGWHLEYLRQLSKRNGGYIAGEVVDNLSLYTLKKAPAEAFEQIRIRVSSGSQNLILKLNDNHEFEIADLKPATYTVELLLPENYISFESILQKVEIGDKGCREVKFSFCLKEAAPPPKSNESPETKRPNQSSIRPR